MSIIAPDIDAGQQGYPGAQPESYLSPFPDSAGLGAQLRWYSSGIVFTRTISTPRNWDDTAHDAAAAAARLRHHVTANLSIASIIARTSVAHVGRSMTRGDDSGDADAAASENTGRLIAAILSWNQADTCSWVSAFCVSRLPAIERV